jgi:hypothetical protein
MPSFCHFQIKNNIDFVIKSFLYILGKKRSLNFRTKFCNFGHSTSKEEELGLKITLHLHNRVKYF